MELAEPIIPIRPEASRMDLVDRAREFDAARAREHAAEIRHFDANTPHFPLGFSVTYRNPGHWDVFAAEVPGRASAWIEANPGGCTSARDGQRERAFRIRGDYGAVTVHDERWNPRRPFPRGALPFASVENAMAWIMAELMREPPPLVPGEGSPHGL